MAAGLEPCAGGERDEGQGFEVSRETRVMQEVDEVSLRHVLVSRGDE